MKRFSKFLDIFVRFVGDNTSILRNTKALIEGKKDVNVTSFILKDSEYTKAINEGSYYRQPVIIV